MRLWQAGSTRVEGPIHCIGAPAPLPFWLHQNRFVESIQRHDIVSHFLRKYLYSLR